MRKFAVFILTHGRADNLITYNTLRSQGYTGQIYYIIDDMDDQADLYKELYGEENVIVFDKREAIKSCDVMDTQTGLNIVLPARNSCHRIAKELGLTHFLELDDDYTSFLFRFPNGKVLDYTAPTDLDSLFEYCLDALDETGALTIALAQGGDFIGGVNGTAFYKRVLRKAMNSFFCRTDRPFQFYGRINEDVNMYTLLGSRGAKIFTITEASLTQVQTQANAGGLTDVYLEQGTYVKSFYSVMLMPSAIKVAMMGGGNGCAHMRIHHNVKWNNCVPKIIDEKWKKRG